MIRAPRLKQLAAQIEKRFPELVARVVEGYCNTDRHPKGVRWRIPGKGRCGNRLVVTVRATGERVLDHNSAETYRHNGEVVRWIEERVREQKTRRGRREK